MHRIAKLISNAGFCSRREAERLILSGAVTINDKVIATPATCANQDDLIKVDGKLLNQVKAPRLWTYYKPVGLITTYHDPQGRTTVFETLKHLPRVISIGRLDIQSEGLLLLTNNGELARYFELPVNKIVRIYRVRAYGNLTKIKLAKFPVTINNIIYNPRSIQIIKEGNNSWFEVILDEGKNREIRKIFEYFDLSVNRLIRTHYGSFNIGDLKPGTYIEQDISKFIQFIQ